MQSIDSEAKVSRATLSQGEAPKHTATDHEHCAYYTDGGGLVCPHEHVSYGAFYSEDHVNQIRELNHRLISLFKTLDKNKEGPFDTGPGGVFHQVEPYYQIQHLSAEHWDEVIMDMINQLEALTK